MWLGDTQSWTDRKLHRNHTKFPNQGRFFWCNIFFCEFAGSLTQSSKIVTHRAILDVLIKVKVGEVWFTASSFVNQNPRWQPTGFLPPPFFSSVGFSNCCIISASLNGMGGIILESYNGQVNLKWMRGCSAQLWQNHKPSYQKKGNW